MELLRYSDLRVPGVTRVRRGRGFAYRAPDGRTVDACTLARVRALAIPPAWTDVWICADDLGHIQATGIDGAGRRQYRYHDQWRACRDRAKFARTLEFAQLLPRLRQVVDRDLAVEGFTRERVLACGVRLLDRGFFRIGGEAYAEANETYGIATMSKHAVRLDGGNRLTFDYVAKSRKRRVQSIVDADVYELVAALKRRRGGGDELLAYRDGRAWRDVRSDDINAYVKSAMGTSFSAKDFRTWNATVLAAVALAVSAPAREREAARRRAVNRAVNEVAHYLGNTPAVCRSSYIDPLVIERYEEGLTIAGALEAIAADDVSLRHEAAIEQAVLDLLERGQAPAAPAACAVRPWEDESRLPLLRRLALEGA